MPTMLWHDSKTSQQHSHYDYDNVGNILTTITGDGVYEYEYSGNELRAYGHQPDSIWTTDPLWLKENGEYYWYRTDHLGTPQQLVDSNGTGVVGSLHCVRAG